MAIDGGFVRKVVEPDFGYVQRAISATRTGIHITWIEITYKSGIITHEINHRDPSISLSRLIGDSTGRKSGLSSAQSLSVGPTLWTLAKVRTPRITFAISPAHAFICGRLFILGRHAKVRLIPNVSELCAEVGRTW